MQMFFFILINADWIKNLIHLCVKFSTLSLKSISGGHPDAIINHEHDLNLYFVKPSIF